MEHTVWYITRMMGDGCRPVDAGAVPDFVAPLLWRFNSQPRARNLRVSSVEVMQERGELGGEFPAVEANLRATTNRSLA